MSYWWVINEKIKKFFKKKIKKFFKKKIKKFFKIKIKKFFKGITLIEGILSLKSLESIVGFGVIFEANKSVGQTWIAVEFWGDWGHLPEFFADSG